MAFVPVNLVPGLGAQEYLAAAGSAYTKGSIIYRNTTLGQVHPITATVGDATTVEAIVSEATGTTATSGTTYIKANPIHSGMFVIADCTANTAESQLNKAHLVTDASTVNNTSTHSTDINAIFVATRVVGASTNKQLYGYIVKLGQVTA